MTETAPERIWAWRQRVQDNHWIGSVCTSKPGGLTQEYVRADLLDDAVKALEAITERAEVASRYEGDKFNFGWMVLDARATLAKLRSKP